MTGSSTANSTDRLRDTIKNKGRCKNSSCKATRNDFTAPCLWDTFSRRRIYRSMPPIAFNIFGILGVLGALFFGGLAFPVNFKNKPEIRPLFLVPALFCILLSGYGFMNWETMFLGKCSEECKWFGQCKSDVWPPGPCYAGSHEDCMNSRDCRRANKCFLKDGLCIEAFYDDCRNSEMCQKEARCFPQNGTCGRSTD